MAKKYLVGVGNVNAYNPTTGDLVFTAKTMMEDGITVSTGKTEIRGGQGNPILYVYYHDSAFEVSLKDAQWNLALVAATIGASVGTGKNIWTEETVTLGVGGTGSVNLTPLTPPDNTTIYGWVTNASGVTTKVTFSTKSFTLSGGSANDVVTVRYFANNAAASTIDVPSNIVPSILRLVIDAQIGSDSAGTGILGSLQVEVPRAQFDGGANISLSSSGVSTTDSKAMALPYTPSGYTKSVYASITEIIDSANWYDNVFALAIADDTIALSSANSPMTLQVYAVPYTGSAFLAPVADLTFTSSDAAKFTAGAHTGILTKVAAGSALCDISITAKSTVTLQTAVTVS